MGVGVKREEGVQGRLSAVGCRPGRGHWQHRTRRPIMNDCRSCLHIQAQSPQPSTFLLRPQGLLPSDRQRLPLWWCLFEDLPLLAIRDTIRHPCSVNCRDRRSAVKGVGGRQHLLHFMRLGLQSGLCSGACREQVGQPLCLNALRIEEPSLQCSAWYSPACLRAWAPRRRRRARHCIQLLSGELSVHWDG